jgi:hypothetical protein
MTNEAAQTVTELRAHLGKSEEKSAPAYIAADASHADALAAVERLLALPTVGLDATGATVHGQGGRPSADIAMSNGAVLTVDSVEENEARHVGPPGRVGTRRTPVVGRPGMLALASCLRRAGEHVQTVTEEAMARDLGVDYLRRAVALAVDMIDTGERWRGFRQLDDWNPWTEARAKGSPLIDVQVVQWDDGTGARFVRTG